MSSPSIFFFRSYPNRNTIVYLVFWVPLTAPRRVPISVIRVPLSVIQVSASRGRLDNSVKLSSQILRKTRLQPPWSPGVGAHIQILFLSPLDLRPRAPACFSSDSLWPWCRQSVARWMANEWLYGGARYRSGAGGLLVLQSHPVGRRSSWTI